MCPLGYHHNGFLATHVIGHSQSFKEVNLGDIRNLVVKVKSLKSKTRFFVRQLLCIQVTLILLWKQLHERCKLREKLLETTIPLRKWIRLKSYSHPVKNVRISSSTFILIFWWVELTILRSDRKVYHNFIFNSEDIWKRKFVFYQTLITFFHIGKPVSSRMLLETSYSDIFYVIRP